MKCRRFWQNLLREMKASLKWGYCQPQNVMFCLSHKDALAKWLEAGQWVGKHRLFLFKSLGRLEGEWNWVNRAVGGWMGSCSRKKWRFLCQFWRARLTSLSRRVWAACSLQAEAVVHSRPGRARQGGLERVAVLRYAALSDPLPAPSRQQGRTPKASLQKVFGRGWAVIYRYIVENVFSKDNEKLIFPNLSLQIISFLLHDWPALRTEAPLSILEMS